MHRRAPLTVVLAAALTACAGPRRTARVEPLAPPLAATVERGLSADRLAVIEPLLLEPLGCPIYAGDDRPDYDSQGLDCLVKWMREASTYLAKGGEPTAYTSQKTFEKNRALARKLAARVEAWVEKARPDVASAPVPDDRRDPAPAPETLVAAGRESQQRFLNGIIYYQKGESEKARKEWLQAVKLDPSNADARAALAKLDSLSSTP